MIPVTLILITLCVKYSFLVTQSVIFVKIELLKRHFFSRFHEAKDCNYPCSCSNTSFNPICDIHGVSHFSACSAGCYNMYRSDKTMVNSAII